MTCQYKKHCKKCACINCPYTDRCGHFWELTVDECDLGYPNELSKCSKKVKKYFKKHPNNYISSTEIEKAIGINETKWYMTKWTFRKIKLLHIIYELKKKVRTLWKNQ